MYRLDIRDIPEIRHSEIPLKRSLWIALYPFALLFLMPATAAQAADWPAFRGPLGDGRSNETGVIPPSGPVSLEVKWKRSLGSAYSGIAIAGDRLVTQYSDGQNDFLVALDTDTGALLWQHPLGPAYAGHDGSHSGPLATPAIGAGLAVGLGARGELVAVDLQSGELRWRRQLTEDFKARKPHFGFSASPRFVGDRLLIALGGYRRALAALDLKGNLLWAAGSDAIEYQSPMLWRQAESDQILLAGNSRLMSFDPTAGEELWSLAHDGAGTRGSYSMAPVPAGADRLFLAHLDHRSKMLRLDSKGPPQEVWDHRIIRNSYASAVFDAGYLYAYSSRFLTCVDAESGQAMWRSRAPGDGFPIWVDGHLLIQAKDGHLRLAQATPAGYRERAQLPLFDDVSWSSPSFADGSIYARSLSEIARVEIVSQSDAKASEDPQNLKGDPHPQALDPLWQRLQAEVLASDRQKTILDTFLKARPGTPFVENGRVHFYFRGQARDVALAGDLPGARREIPFSRLANTDLFFLSLEVAPRAAFSYLLVVDFQRIADPRNPKTAVNTVFGEDFEPVLGAELEMSFFALDPGLSSDATEPEPKPATATGSIERFDFASEEMGRAVEIAVYLPADFSPSSRNLPTVYWLGGQDALSWGQAKATLDRLHAEGRLPSLLVVFLLNSDVGGLDSLGAMLTQELIPHIEARFGASPDRESRALAGMGWDGLAASHIGLAHGRIFGHLALQSVYALTHSGGGPPAWARQASRPYPKVYLDWGTYDLRNSHEAWSTVDDNQRLFETLELLGFEVSGGEVPEGSSWASWGRRTERWLLEIFAGSTAP